MSNSLKQSMKQRLKSVAKERDLTFDEIWHNLILERFLARLCQSKYVFGNQKMRVDAMKIESQRDEKLRVSAMKK